MMRNKFNALVARVRRYWRTKVWLGVALTIVFCAGYFGLQRIHLGSARTFAPSMVDEWVPLSPAWTGVYFSMYVMLPLAWLAETRAQLMRYAVGLSLIAAVGLTCFFVFPVAGPRPAYADGGLLALLHRIDAPTNSFPSLHMALATYSACFCAYALGRRPGWLIATMSAWVVLIGYSTLATRQHYFVDLPPGIALGWLAHAAAGAWPVASVRAIGVARAEGGAT
jgi:membrane-associated phospholipid phosphatase